MPLKRYRQWSLTASHVAAGVLTGVVVLHPVTMVIYWFEMHPSSGFDEALRFAIHRVTAAFEPTMLPMTVAFTLVGGTLGFCSALYSLALRKRERQLTSLSRLLDQDLASLLLAGESERLERKASARWDTQRAAANRDLGTAIVRTIAGFLNSEGGTLLIGVADDGRVIGLEADYQTLHTKDRDGFERFLLDQVAQRLGSDACRLVHILFHAVEAKDVCRVAVEPAPGPIFVRDGAGAHLYVRTGNATRELDAEEALRHVASRSAHPQR